MHALLHSMLTSHITLMQVQYGSEAFDKLADMIYTTLDQYGIYQSYLHYTDYNKLMLYSTGAASTTEAGTNTRQLWALTNTFDTIPILIH